MSQSPIEDLTYEQARDELVRVVSQLESGGVNLEQSLSLWERGEALAEHCQQWLDGARQRVNAAVTGPPDAPSRAQRQESAEGQDSAEGQGSSDEGSGQQVEV